MVGCRVMSTSPRIDFAGERRCCVGFPKLQSIYTLMGAIRVGFGPEAMTHFEPSVPSGTGVGRFRSSPLKASKTSMGHSTQIDRVPIADAAFRRYFRRGDRNSAYPNRWVMIGRNHNETTETMKPTDRIKTGLVALALQFGIVAGAHAGGPALLQLPLEGVTAKNSTQYTKLIEEKLGVVVSGWNNSASGNREKVKDGSTNVIQFQLGRKDALLSDVEKVLEGSPFTIKREELEYFGVVQLRIGKIADHEKLTTEESSRWAG